MIEPVWNWQVFSETRIPMTFILERFARLDLKSEGGMGNKFMVGPNPN